MKISDDKLISDVLELGSVSAAARKNKLTPNALYKRLRSPELRERLTEAQDSAICSAAGGLTMALDGAVEALVEVCRNPLNAPGVRVAAADSLLRHGLRYMETANILQRIEALEAAQNDS